MFKLDLEKTEEPEIKLPTSVGSSKKQESSRKTSASLATPMPLPVWITANWKILQQKRSPDLPPEKSCMQVKKQQLELDMEQQTDSKLGEGSTSTLYIVTLFI